MVLHENYPYAVFTGCSLIVENWLYPWVIHTHDVRIPAENLNFKEYRSKVGYWFWRWGGGQSICVDNNSLYGSVLKPTADAECSMISETFSSTVWSAWMGSITTVCDKLLQQFPSQCLCRTGLLIMHLNNIQNQILRTSLYKDYSIVKPSDIVYTSGVASDSNA